jgi:hypothetical protein
VTGALAVPTAVVQVLAADPTTQVMLVSAPDLRSQKDRVARPPGSAVT